MSEPILRYFAFDHLHGPQRTMSELASEYAHLMDESFPDSAEKSAGLRKLLEAKDCFVRASLDGMNS